MKFSIKPINPGRDPLHVEKQIKAIENAMEGTAKAIKVDLLVTAQTWTHKPTFTIERPGDYERVISTGSKIYGYVSEGTRPHIIRPRNAQRLAFQTGYKAKTSPNVIASRPGGKFGPTVYSREVKHPGTQARNFTKAIGKKWGREFPRTLQRAIAAANY